MNEETKAKIRVMLIEAIGKVTGKIAEDEMINIWWAENLESRMADASMCVLQAAAEACDKTVIENDLSW